ncbi:hypothetical protein Tco_1113153 [Tanacetum coccineum]|uniref:Retrotransposon protein, putative, Ty1-copia subclass n=1 Tax=Tanacetum coccineum TaxID=301880 RepID=A0ABQ5ISW4_9ASTR
MENSKYASVPIQEKPNLSKAQGANTSSEVNRMQRVPYASAIGSIMYAVRCTRPDVAFVLILCSRFQQNPGEAHWTVVKTILKYLKNTKDMVLIYRGKPETGLKVTCYTDAKAEYIAGVEASMEAVRMRKFINELGNVVPTNKRPMEMLCDYMPAIATTNNPGIMKGARHYQRKYHYICEVIQDGEIILKKVHTDDNVAYPFTKPMPYTKHFEHAMMIGVRLTSSLLVTKKSLSLHHGNQEN